jgi:hypothetical protein
MSWSQLDPGNITTPNFMFLFFLNPLDLFQGLDLKEQIYGKEEHPEEWFFSAGTKVSGCISRVHLHFIILVS